jgi:hypothetical protein
MTWTCKKCGSETIDHRVTSRATQPGRMIAPSQLMPLRCSNDQCSRSDPGRTTLGWAVPIETQTRIEAAAEALLPAYMEAINRSEAERMRSPDGAE